MSTLGLASRVKNLVRAEQIATCRFLGFTHFWRPPSMFRDESCNNILGWPYRFEHTKKQMLSYVSCLFTTSLSAEQIRAAVWAAAFATGIFSASVLMRIQPFASVCLRRFALAVRVILINSQPLVEGALELLYRICYRRHSGKDGQNAIALRLALLIPGVLNYISRP